jgi:hypothetical protein
MTSLWQIPAAIFTLVAWLTSPTASLADASRREAFRRQITAKSQSAFSNQNLPPARPSDIASAVSPAAGDGGDAPAEVAVDAAAPGAAAPVPAAIPAASDEKTWRDRTAALIDTLASDQVLVESLQSRVAGLQNDFYGRDDPAQRAMLGEQLAKTRVELERLKTKVEADRTAIEKLQTDARRQGVPPGWLR